jgi:uncharacterized protein YbjQ (UPF0145 family)
MNCPNCGLEQPEGEFCVNCQSALPRPLTASETKSLSQSGEKKKTAPVPPSSPPIEISLINPEASSPSLPRSVSASGTEQFQKVMVTTTPTVEVGKIFRYGDLVCCQAVVKLDGWEEFLEKVKGVSSLRNSPYGDLFKKAEIMLMSDLKIEAAKKGASAVIGVTIHYEFKWENAVMVHASGTVVYLEDTEKG